MQKITSALIAHREAIRAATSALGGFAFLPWWDRSTAKGQVSCRIAVETEPHADAAVVEFTATEEITFDSTITEVDRDSTIEQYLLAVERSPAWVMDETCIIHLQQRDRSSSGSGALDSRIVVKWRGLASWRA